MKTDTKVIVRNENGQTSISNYLDTHDGWFTSKELHQYFGTGRIASINRCLRKLCKFKFVKREEVEQTNCGKEYRYKSTQWIKK